MTNDSDDVDTIPGEGPDIGTVSNPVAVIRDGPGGNLVALTVGLTREGAINGVFINVHETVSQTRGRPEGGAAEPTTPGGPGLRPDWDDVLRGRPADDPDPESRRGRRDDHDDPRSRRSRTRRPGTRGSTSRSRRWGPGPIKWGDKYGRQNIVLERNVKRINDNVINAQIHRAKRLLHRRGGVIRSVDLDAVGLYWLEPDDKVRIKYAGRTEAHYVASIEFDLAGRSRPGSGPGRLTRDGPGLMSTPTAAPHPAGAPVPS